MAVPFSTMPLPDLECDVEHRMECGDHWLVYAVVKNGQVLRSNVKTAVSSTQVGQSLLNDVFRRR